MKRFLLSCVVCVLTHLQVIAQNGYRPIVENGKRWTYESYLPTRPDKYNHYYWYELRGDSIICDQKCTKLYSENKYNDGNIRYEGALYEIDRKVYCFYADKDESVLLYDFSCQVGDKLISSEGVMTVSSQYTSQNSTRNLRFTELSVEDSTDKLYVYWIEGVGCIKDFFSMIPYSGNYCSLTACEVNGEILYEYKQPKWTEEGYHEMAIEGKRWNYIHHFEDENGIHDEPYSYVVRGDTVLGRTVCKKVFYQDESIEQFAFSLLETGREVYKLMDGKSVWTEPYNFERDDIGRVFDWNSKFERGRVYWMLNTIDTIEINSYFFRRFIFLEKTIEGGTQGMISHIEDGDDVWHEIWIEGVGSQYTGIEDPIHEEPIVSNDYTYFVSCYENGKCIFTAGDFTTGIRDLPAQMVNSKSSDGTWYDLSGRRLSVPSASSASSVLPPGVYIKDGKKVMVK